MIEAKAVRWLLIISGIIAMTLIAPPIGVVLMLGLAGCGVFRLNRWRARRAAERRAQRQMYWTPDRIRQTYYS